MKKETGGEDWEVEDGGAAKLGVMEAARSQVETSSFETSHVLGSLLAASPLLADCWRLCADADASAAGFAAVERGGVVYVGFSGVPAAVRVQEFCGEGAFELAPIAGNVGAGVFGPPLVAAGAVLVQALALGAFVELFHSMDFKMLLGEMKDKAVVFAGHSIGGCIASLAALHRLCGGAGSLPAPAPPVLCVTFGSPLLGNETLSRAVQRERWAGSFVHVVSQHDVVPRLLFCPGVAASRVAARLLLRVPAMSAQETAELHSFVARHLSDSSTAQYTPFGSYALCSQDGAACIDSPTAIVQLLSITFSTGWTATSSTAEAAHHCYKDLVVTMPRHLLLKKRIILEDKSNYDAGVSLALQASGVGVAQGAEAAAAKECLKKRLQQSPSLKSAALATKLGKVTPYRAQIEWYKEAFDGSETGYYDAFKQRRSPKKYARANICRVRLGAFWDSVVGMLESGELPLDFAARAKWVNAARFYQLLVEPLDIADHYRRRTGQHYLAGGRSRRYEVFDRWWKEKQGKRRQQQRRKLAGLTQDPCFWARVEEAVEDAAAGRRAAAEEFERYARRMVEMKEVSADALAPRSTFTLWLEAWREADKLY